MSVNHTPLAVAVLHDPRRSHVHELVWFAFVGPMSVLIANQKSGSARGEWLYVHRGNR